MSVLAHLLQWNSTYKVGRIHNAILHRVRAVQGELQDLLLLLATLLLDFDDRLLL